MDLSEFYKKYLIALIIASPQYADEVFMMVPVRVNSQGERTSKYLADNEYLNMSGHCIFLKDNKCSIHNLKPYGGRFLQCEEMTGNVSIQLGKSQYFAYWKDNQHLFETVFPGYEDIFNRLKQIFSQMNLLFIEKRKREYHELKQKTEKIIETELYPLFNNVNASPNGWKVLFENYSR
jgi:Fe-S-cluster containining protein